VATSTIGTLTVDVLANIASMVTSLQQGQQEANKFAAGLQSTMQGAVDGVTRTFSQLAGVIGIAFSVDKVVEFGRSIADQAEKVNRLSQSLGASTQSIQTIGFAASLTGGSLDTVSTALEKLERSSVQAQSGNAQMAEAFRAIGVSVTDANGKLKSADQLFTEVAQHLSQFADGPTKTAVAMQLMGRGAAEQIPFLNQLGSNIDALREQAEALGVVLSDKDQQSLNQFNESLHLLGQTSQGIGNVFMSELAPALTNIATRLQIFLASGDAKNWAKTFADAIKSVIDWFDRMRIDFDTIVDALIEAFARWSAGVDIAILNVKSYLTQLKNDAIDTFVALSKFTNPEAATALDAWADGMKKGSMTASQYNAELAKINKTMNDVIASAHDDLNASMNEVAANQKAAAAVELINDALVKYHAELGQKGADKAKIEMDAMKALDSIEKGLNLTGTAAVVIHQALQKATDDVTSSFDRATNGAAQYNGHVKDTAAALDATRLSNQKFLDSLDGVGDQYGQLGKDTDTYVAHIDDILTRYDKLIKEGASVAEANAFLTAALEKNDDAFARENETIQISIEVADRLNQKFKEQLDSIKGVSREMQIDKQYTQDLAIAEAALVKAYGPGAQASEEYKQALHDLAAAHVDEMNAAKQAADVERQWQGIVASGFDSVGKTIADFATRGIKSWHDFGQALVSDAKQFIAEIIAEFLKLTVFNGILNNLFGLTGASALPSGLGNGLLGQIFSGSGGTSGGGGIQSLLGGDNSIGGWISNLFGGGGGAMGPGADLASDFMGPPAELAGSGGSVLGGLGGIMGSLGPMLGAFSAGSALGGTAGGIGLAAAAYFVPVIGWIAGAASLINSLTGGGLFGTSWKPTGNSAENISIGSGGADISETIEESKKKALFGGRAWKTANVPVDPATVTSLDSFFSTLQSGLSAFAAQFNQTAQVVGGTFNATFDKTGKQTGSTTTIGGQTYSNETVQQFQERVQANSFLAVLDKMGLGASKFVSAVQGDADKLLAAVQDFASATQAANTNLAAGFKLMALPSTQTLPMVMAFAEKMQQAGETLSQTYARLVQAQQAYNQFVAQFQPATTYVDAFEGGMSQLYQQMTAAIAQANALAQATGAVGASTKDLTNIQKSYAAQMAQLTMQLQASAQSLAFSLGLTTQGTLDQVTAQINALQSQAGSASTSLNNFGGAIRNVAANASAAMNLMLGNLSPLNDQQKLQIALQGLRAGTVTADQVLNIGRSLYASSEAYNELFAEVEPYAGRGGHKATGGAGSHGGQHGLSSADQAKLKALQAEQATLQAGQTLGQYQTLAQQIAEIATAKGQTITQVLKDMGIKQQDLEKGLGIKNDADFASYMSKLQQQVDSAGTNTQSIVTAINNLPLAIANAINGRTATPPTAPRGAATPLPGGPSRPPQPPSTNPPTGPSVPGTRNLTDGDADAIGKANAKYMKPIISNPGASPRSGRVPASVR
jgi:hypothetical protein